MKEAKPVEVRIEGLKILQFFDKKFVELIKKDLEGIKFQHVCFYIPEKEEGKKKTMERIIIGHDNPEDEKNEIINIGTAYPETLEKILRIVKEFHE